MAYPSNKNTPPPPMPHTYENNISYRLSKVEELAEELFDKKNKLSDAVLLLGVQIEQAIKDLSGRIKHFEDRRIFWNKILSTVIAAAIIAFLARQSWWVQINRGPGGN